MAGADHDQMNRTRYWWIIAVAAIVALLAPLQQASAGARGSAGRLGTGRAVLRAQRGAAGEPAGHRPGHLEVLQRRCRHGDEPADGQRLIRWRLGYADDVRQVYLGRQHRGLPVGRGVGQGSRADQHAPGCRPDPGHAHGGAAPAAVRRLPVPVVRHDERSRAQQPWSGGLHPRGDADEQQLLLLVQRRQRLVRLRAHRGAAGHAGAGAPGGQPDRADELRDLLRQPGRDPLQYQPGDHGEPADRPDVRRVLRRAAAVPGQQRGAVLLPQRRVLQRPADLGLHRHGPAPDAGQRVVAQLAGTAAAGAVRRLPEHRPGLLLAGPVADGRILADLHRPAIRSAVSRLGGALHLSGLQPHVHPDLLRRNVRGADAERGRTGDQLGHAQLRACRCPHR